MADDTGATERMLTPAQAARMIGVTRRSLYNWRRNGTGPEPYVEVSPNRFRYPESSVRAFIAARLRGTDAPFVMPGKAGE